MRKKVFTGLEREEKKNVKFSRSMKNNSISLERKQFLSWQCSSVVDKL